MSDWQTEDLVFLKKSSKTFFRVLELLSKIPYIMKISNEHFILCEVERSLDEFTKFR